MTGLPSFVSAYLLAAAGGDRHAAWIAVDEAGRVRAKGGALGRHGLDDLARGHDLHERLPACTGLVPPGARPVVLATVPTPAGHAELHVATGPDGRPFVVLLDVTDQTQTLQALQQHVHERGLGLVDDGPVLDRTLAALRVAVWEFVPGGALRPVGPAPDWLGRLGWSDAEARADPASRSPFLENFLVDARAVWDGGGEGLLRSGPFTEVAPDGIEQALEALAVRLPEAGGALVLQALEESFRERRDVLQAARRTSLAYEELQQQIQQKELLLHCIVHDLTAPLNVIVGSLSLLRKPGLDEARRAELLEMGLRQASRQQGMIRLVLDVFAAEIESMESFSTDAATAPDVRSVARETVAAQATAAESRRVALALEGAGADLGALPVVGRADHLERVLANLLQNAIRHSPRDGTVTVAVEERGSTVRVAVEDEGPGVSAEAADRLFEKLGRDRRSGGVAGLGLYFARYTVERWGGAIGFEPRSPGGARFWIRLPRAPAGPVLSPRPIR